MNATVRRWYSVLLLRDARGRFTWLCATLTMPAPATPPRRRRLCPAPAIQLVLF
jgi:hypothetical protein